MTTLPFDVLKESILALLTEAHAGPPDPHVSWFIDNEPDSGVLGAVRNLSAAEASRSVDGSGRSGTTIASNIEHLRWCLSNANGALRGQPYQYAWEESWKVITVEEAAWDKLRQDLETEYTSLLQAVSAQTELPGVYLTGVLALIPHTAFHLGLIRQMVEQVREKSNLFEGTHDQGI